MTIDKSKHIHFEPVSIRHSIGIVADPVGVYYERLEPEESAGKPIVVMIHGGSHSGGCYQLTIDGRPGWAYVFAAHGYPVIAPDWPGMGRSGAVQPADTSFETICAGFQGLLNQIGGSFILLTHSMGGALGWRLAELCAEKIAAIVAIAPGPPGNIQPIPQVLSRADGVIEVQTPSRKVRLTTAPRVRNEAPFIDDKLIGKSQFFPRDRRDTYAASLLETPTALIAQRINLDGSEVRVGDPSCFGGKPVLVVTGTEDIEHPRETDAAIVDWLNANGAKAEFLWLGDRGITGGGHMLMLESNSDETAGLILEWLDGALPKAR